MIVFFSNGSRVRFSFISVAWFPSWTESDMSGRIHDIISSRWRANPDLWATLPWYLSSQWIEGIDAMAECHLDDKVEKQEINPEELLSDQNYKVRIQRSDQNTSISNFERYKLFIWREMETPENSLFSSSLFRIMYLLIEWEGRTGNFGSRSWRRDRALCYETRGFLLSEHK